MRRIILAFLLCVILLGKAQAAFSEDTATSSLINAVNTSGLTGLVRTASAETIGPRQISLGASGDFEDSRAIRGTVTLGITRITELALMFPYLRQSGNGQSGQSGAGDLEIAGKWRVLERENLPALAVAASVITPTGSDSKGLNTVHRYGFTFKGIASANLNLLPLNNYVFGLFAEAGMFIRDLGQIQEEKHGFYGAGIMLPINFLQLLLEVNGTVKDQSTSANNVVTFTPSLRFVAKHFSLSAGYEYTARESANNYTSGGIVAASVTF